MTKARTLADFISDGNPLADGTISVSEVSGAAPLANPDFTGGIDVTGASAFHGNGNAPIAWGDTTDVGFLSFDGSGNAIVRSETGARLNFQVNANRDVLSMQNGSTIFNESGNNQDFRVESDGNTHALFVDAGLNKVLIGSSGAPNVNPASSRLYDAVVDNGISIGNGGYTHGFIGTGGTDGNVEVVANSYPANAGSERYVKIKGGSSGGGGPNEMAHFASGIGAVFNDAGSNFMDFRVESDSNTHMLFVDAGINAVQVGSSTVPTSGGFQSPALYVKGTTTGIYGITHFEAQENDSLLGLGHVSGGDFVFRTSYRSTGAFSDVVFEDYNGNSVLQLGMKSNTAETVFNNTGVDHDFRVESDGNANMLFVDAGNNKVGVGTNAPLGLGLTINGGTTAGAYFYGGTNNRRQLIFTSFNTASLDAGHTIQASSTSGRIRLVAGSREHMKIDAVSNTTVFNEDGADQDFRVESDAGPYAFYMDAGANSGYGRTKITSYAPSSNTSVEGGTSDTYINGLTIENNEASYTNGGLALVNKQSWGYGSSIKWYNIYDGAGTSGTLGETNRIQSQYVSANNMDTVFYSMIGASVTETLSLGASGTIFNDGGIDNDFRVESDSSTVMLFVDAGNNALGINNGSPSSYPANSFTGTATDGGLLRIGGNVGAICMSGTGNEIAFTRNSANYIGAFGGAAHIRIRAGTSGGVSLGNTATSWSSLSDERLKTITGNIENASDKVKTLRTVIGRYNDESETTSHAFLIAQDVQLVLPQAVSVLTQDEALESDGIQNKLQLSYTEVIPLLTAALKEAITKIETLEARITALENA